MNAGIPLEVREKLDRDYKAATPTQRRAFRRFLWRALADTTLSLARGVVRLIGAWCRGEDL